MANWYAWVLEQAWMHGTLDNCLSCMLVKRGLSIKQIDDLDFIIYLLRKLPQTENIPIVGWSADFKSNPQQKLLQHAGITDYLQKPTALKDICAIIERFLPMPERQN